MCLKVHKTLATYVLVPISRVNQKALHGSPPYSHLYRDQNVNCFAPYNKYSDKIQKHTYEWP